MFLLLFHKWNYKIAMATLISVCLGAKMEWKCQGIKKYALESIINTQKSRKRISRRILTGIMAKNSENCESKTHNCKRNLWY